MAHDIVIILDLAGQMAGDATPGSGYLATIKGQAAELQASLEAAEERGEEREDIHEHLHKLQNWLVAHTDDAERFVNTAPST